MPTSPWIDATDFGSLVSSDPLTPYGAGLVLPQAGLCSGQRLISPIPTARKSQLFRPTRWSDRCPSEHGNRRTTCSRRPARSLLSAIRGPHRLKSRSDGTSAILLEVCFALTLNSRRTMPEQCLRAKNTMGSALVRKFLKAAAVAALGVDACAGRHGAIRTE